MRSGPTIYKERAKHSRESPLTDSHQYTQRVAVHDVDETCTMITQRVAAHDVDEMCTMISQRVGVVVGGELNTMMPKVLSVSK